MLRALNDAKNDLNRVIVRSAQVMFYEKYVEEYDWEGSNLEPREERYLEDPGWGEGGTPLQTPLSLHMLNKI